MPCDVKENGTIQCLLVKRSLGGLEGHQVRLLKPQVAIHGLGQLGGKNLLISSWWGLSVRPRVKLSVAPETVFKFIEMALYCNLFLVKCENSECGWYDI